SREYADIFLKNNGKPRLFIEAASVPEGREVEIAIDGSSVGQLRVPHRWGLLTLPVGPQEGEILRISLRVKGVEKYPKDRECWWPRRSLGVAVTQIGLCAESEFIPPRNPVTFSQKLLRTLAYKSSSLLRRNPA
ncbi:hypothetical protein HY256_04725, partial [Candidatus Sumerlaeota bacterium]|nr:hypothetical protein [Candidatus Sumerlaeota bacterium]